MQIRKETEKKSANRKEIRMCQNTFLEKKGKSERKYFQMRNYFAK
jgi:hypothetical protein